MEIININLKIILENGFKIFDIFIKFFLFTNTIFFHTCFFGINKNTPKHAFVKRIGYKSRGEASE